ncbi:hypothetical protein MD484_g7152, partial [Candolleomyces efflorescens]
MASTAESSPHDFWATDELVLRTMDFLPHPDLRNCVQVSQSFNRIAVQSVLDRLKIWNAEHNATLPLANNPNDLDGLSALLLSVHVKSLSLVVFDLGKVTSLKAALKTFDKMQRLVERVESVHTVHVRWPSGAYGVNKQPQISDKALVSAFRCVEEFFSTVITKGCTSLQFTGFDAFASIYQLKKHPAITAAASKALKASPTVERSTSSSPIWGSAWFKGYLPSRHTRAATPWISLTPPSPKLGEVTKLARLLVQSTTVLRPPFSQWLFGILQASPVIYMSISLEDTPDNKVEFNLMLDRLAEALPKVITIHLVDGARAGVMKDTVAWLGQFQLLESVRIEPECFFAAGNTITTEDLGPLARLPNIRELVSSSSFICAYIAARHLEVVYKVGDFTVSQGR